MKQATMQDTKTTVRFSGSLIRRDDEDGSGSLVNLPNEASAELSSRGTTMVEGTIDGFPFRAALESVGDNGHRLRISKAVQDAAGAHEGDLVTVEITRVEDEPEIRVPSDLLEAIEAAPQVQGLWEEITPMARREWIRWVASAKQEETRARRIEVGIDKLRKGMRRPCCFPGLNWVTRDLVTAEETWLPLPGSKNSGKP
jgi:Uncharacterized protein conserved in bacteria